MVRRIYNLCLYMRHQAANSVDAFLDGIVRCGHARYGARLRHTITYRQFRQIERLVEFLHQLRGNTTASCDARAQVLEALVWNGAVRY